MNEVFELSEELLKLQEGGAVNYYIPNETDIRGKSDIDLARYLNDITDSVEESSGNIVDSLVFDKIRSFIKYFPFVQPRIASRLFDIVLAAFRVEIKTTYNDLEKNTKETYNTHKQVLEMYGFLVHWFLTVIEEANVTKTHNKKNKHTEDKEWDWIPQKIKAYDSSSWLLEMRLSRIWTLTPERVKFVNLFTKSIYQLFENPLNTKSAKIKERAFRILSICIKNYDHLFVAQTTIMQNLQYWEHSAETMAELLVYMAEKQDYTQLADEILREIGNREFKDVTKEVKDSPNPKTFTLFLQKLAELSHKIILKNMAMLIHQLDSESYLMRMCILDILGGMIAELAETAEENPIQLEQINKYFDCLEERTLDSIAYCRQKVFQVYIRLFDLKPKFPKRRYAAGLLAIRHLEDKSSMVRKYAIRLLTKLITTHPYSMYGGELDMDDWTDKLNKLDKEIEHLKSEGDMQSFIEVLETSKKDDDDTEMDEASNKENEPVLDEPVTSEPVDKSATKTVISAEKHQQLILMHTFCKDAIRFIKLIHLAIPTISQLLSSKSKAEVLESMDFLVVAYNYKVKLASEGIKKMLHLIWTKDTSDEGKGIKMKLISCYQNLYLDMDGKLTRKENINNVAKNLIQLTYNTNLAELTSLEQLLSTLMAENKFSGSVIDKLWSVYGFTKGNIQKSQRRGSIIILAMLAKAKTSVVADKIDVLLKIGLGPLGKSDLILAKHTCIALQRLEGTKSKDKGRGVQEGVRFPVNHPIFLRLIDIIETPSKSQEWFSLTEQAINTIYLLCENPEVLCEEIIKDRTKKVFGDRELSPPINEPSSMTDSMLMNYDMSMTQQALPVPKHPVYKDSLELSQLFFMVGHVALKHIVHLEIVESAWKRKKSKIDKEHKMQEGNNTSIEDELEQVGGTADDDIGDAITLIREREMLFGSNSLLSRFGPLLSEVCSRNKVYTDRTLQITSTLSLAKLMCVSSEFCEKHLQLLFTILEKSKDATIRSNIVIALGDMAVCFNTLIDDNITFLYNRLSDPDSFVKKNAVMVLTHLILNGMVKVKGQISEMAKCLEDPDQRIADLAKLFFTELASKDNAIYNNLPDIISNLTSNKSAETRIAEEPFRKIMKFIFSFDFTEKEKQAENIIDKLCQRFLTAEDERSWRDIAYCLSLLPFKSEKSFKKLSEGWPSYQDKIHEESVHKSFLEIITKARFQKTQKPELKSLIDDLEKKIEKQWAPEAEKEKITKKALKQANKAKEDAPKQKKTPVRQAKRKRYIESDSEEDEEELDLPDVEDSSDEAEMEVEEGVEEESEEGEGESEEGEGESEEEGEGTAEEEEAAEEEAAEEGGSDKVAEEAAEGEEVSEKGSEEEESEEGAEEESDEDEEMGVDSMDVDEESDSS